MHIEFQRAVEADHIPSETQIHHWIKTALEQIPEKIPESQNELLIRFIDEAESAELNETFRHKKGPTNVLAFEDKPLAGLSADTLGDLAICVSIVEKEALEQHKSLEAHWAHLIIHGLLHLMGYDHLEEADAHRMETQETLILHTLGYEDPYAT